MTFNPVKLKRGTVSITLMCSLVASFLVSDFQQAVSAGPVVDEVTVGKPSIWSFSQAHYLLSSLKERSQALKTKELTDVDLDANATNRVSFETLRSVLGADVEFDSAIGTTNRLKLQHYKENVDRLNTLKTLRDQRKDQHLEVIHQLTESQSRRAKLKSELPNPVPANPTPEIQGKQTEIAKLDQKITALEVEKEALDTEVKAINAEMTTLDTDLSKLSLGSVFSGNGSGGNGGGGAGGGGGTTTPSPLTKAEIMELIGTKNSPKLTASTMLDNYIQLQYELISKQLTLLRDEVGPNQRVVFLELPCSIFLSPKTANNNLAQVRWRVSRYQETKEQQTKALSYVEVSQKASEWKNVTDRNAFQTIDIIPRQSALNVAQVHNTVNGFNLSAKLVWLFGLGTKVSYERQRQLYDQFLYQDIFASGFGKGERDFGWTFGPLPGTKSIAPGLRTTYAVLSVPREASVIELEGAGFSFPRKDGPANFIQNNGWEKFNLIIPREADGFDISEIDYVPVKAGEEIAAVLRGNYFSPQIGVLINGTPLRRVIAIAATPANSNPNPPPPPPIEGVFEYISSDTVILKWKMPATYEGTPIITLVTPQSTSSINGKTLKIRGETGTLAAVSNKDPMFFQPLDVMSVDVTNNPNNTVAVKVKGRGFKPKAEILVNGVTIKDPTHVSTSEYAMSFNAPASRRWHISVRQKIDQGNEEDDFDYEQTDTTVTYEILDYKYTAKTPLTGRAKLNVLFNLNNMTDTNGVTLEPFTPKEAIMTPGAEHGSNRLNYNVETEVNPVRLNVMRGGRVLNHISLYWPQSPHIKKIINENFGPNGIAEGEVDGGYRVRIIGINLLQVTSVKFGTTAAQIQERSDDTLVVVAPRGQKGQVFVTLTTNITYKDNPVSNLDDFDDSDGKAFFKYVPPPPTTQANSGN